MAERKQTPDVLGEILGDVAAVPAPPMGAPRARTVPADRPARQPRPIPEVCWEYLVVSFQNHRGWRPRFLNGDEVADWAAGPLLHDYLATMGTEGWELAAASAGELLYGSGDLHQLYFKRRSR